MNAEALIYCNKLFSARNQYMDDVLVKWMSNFGHHVDEEKDGSIEDEDYEEDYEEKEEIKEI